MKEGLGIIAVIALVIACALTNPRKQDHLQALEDNNALIGDSSKKTEASETTIIHNNEEVTSTNSGANSWLRRFADFFSGSD